MRRIFIYLICALAGFLITRQFIGQSVQVFKNPGGGIEIKFSQNEPRVIGFLPYWLIDKTDKDYAPFITERTYFALTVNSDGTIKKFDRPGEAEPGWYALTSGKFAVPENTTASLAVFSGDPDVINALIGEPEIHAVKLAEELKPVMADYGFSAVNLDLENVADASESARQNFTAFVKTLKSNLGGRLTIDASPTDLVKTRTIDLAAVVPLVDQVILMTYDYHFAGSMVTGPVAPNAGAGVESEFDVETGIQKALAVLPAEKIILGVPLYGYEWETLLPESRAAVLPGSGIVASGRRAEEFLAGCASCSTQREEAANEAYVIFKNQETGTYHQIFYPDEKSIQSKFNLVKKYRLGGLAFWALGYESDSLLKVAAP